MDMRDNLISTKGFMTQINLKNITLLLLLPAFTMALVGCGGGGTENQDIPQSEELFWNAPMAPAPKCT